MQTFHEYVKKHYDFSNVGSYETQMHDLLLGFQLYIDTVLVPEMKADIASAASEEIARRTTVPSDNYPFDPPPAYHRQARPRAWSDWYGPNGEKWVNFWWRER